MSQAEDRLNCQNVAYVERLLELFQRDPARVPTEWQDYFRQIDGSGGNGQVRFAPSFRPASLFNPPTLASGDSNLRGADWHERVGQLVRAYRVRGHLAAKLNPLGIDRPEPAELDIGFHGLVRRARRAAATTRRPSCRKLDRSPRRNSIWDQSVLAAILAGPR